MMRIASLRVLSESAINAWALLALKRIANGKNLRFTHVCKCGYRKNVISWKVTTERQESRYGRV